MSKCNGEPGRAGCPLHDADPMEHIHDCDCCGGCEVCHGGCKNCGGTGWIAEYETIVEYVTSDMASDAGEPEMEGMPMSHDVEHEVPCPTYRQADE